MKIYHNLHCSESRAALALIEQFSRREGVEHEVIEYLKQPPTLEQLAQLQPARADDAGLLAAQARHAALLRPPIVT